MRLNWTVGARIGMLPRLLQPIAILVRNLLVATNLKKSWDNWTVAKYRAEVFTKLTLGVHYTYGECVDGDIAEFGTMTGKTAAAMAKEIALSSARHGSTARKLHLFDSFEGLPDTTSPVDANSPHVRSGAWSGGTCRGLTKEQLRRKCERFLAPSRIIIHEGWFADTIKNLPPQTSFALLHIDSDLYQSAVDVLDGCLGRGFVSEGAAVFFDDWNGNRASPHLGERRAWAEAVDKFGVEFSDCGEYGFCGRKFIVHSYRK